MPERKNILITGASSGIGWAMAKEYAQMGRNLALCARRVDKLEELKREIVTSHPGVQVWIRELDVNDHEHVFDIFRDFAKDLGQLDRVIVNAGMGKGATVGTGSFAANKKTATTNFISVIAQCEAALEIFRDQNCGHLVTISSLTAVSGFAGTATVYAATKAAVTSLSEGMRIDLLDTPIKVTTIHPGYIRTEMTQNLKRMPFAVGPQTGARVIIKAIEKEGANYFVPTWPWAMLARLLPFAPLRVLAKLS